MQTEHIIYKHQYVHGSVLGKDLKMSCHVSRHHETYAKVGHTCLETDYQSAHKIIYLCSSIQSWYFGYLCAV